MQVGDISTITIKKNPANGNFPKVIEREWLEFLGYSQKEIDGEEISLVFKAEVSDRKKLKFIGFGKPI